MYGNVYTLDGLGLVCFNVVMKKLFILLFFISGFSSSQTWGANFDKGMAAYKSGDYVTALREWTPLAEQGFANAQSNLGNMHFEGLGLPQDFKTALKWYTLSAEQGNIHAQYALGNLHRDGLGVPQNGKTAVKWYTLSAEQGFPTAQSDLGNMYAKGRGVIQDYQTAVK